jgi:hypothetical protein
VVFVSVNLWYLESLDGGRREVAGSQGSWRGRAEVAEVAGVVERS